MCKRQINAIAVSLPANSPRPMSLSSPPCVRVGELMNIQRTRCPRNQLAGPARLTYILVDHKWVCFADCCLWGLARHARGSVEYASLWGPASLVCPAIWRPAYRFYNLHRTDKPEVCLPVVPRHSIARASGTSKRYVIPRCAGHRSYGAATNTRVAGML